MIAIKKNGVTTADIGPETVLRRGDIVAVIGKIDNVEKFEMWLRG
jgi:K+/H+ antiporter YhaU regulatory subunit KhtT